MALNVPRMMRLREKLRDDVISSPIFPSSASEYRMLAWHAISPLLASLGPLTCRVLANTSSSVVVVATWKSVLSLGIGFPLWDHCICSPGLPVALQLNWTEGGRVVLGWMVWNWSLDRKIISGSSEERKEKKLQWTFFVLNVQDADSTY